MTAATGNAVEEAQIRALIDDRAKVVRGKDVNGAISGIARQHIVRTTARENLEIT
jgi:hypothetical protein